MGVKGLTCNIENTVILFVCPSKILHKHCFQFILGPLKVPRENKDSFYSFHYTLPGLLDTLNEMNLKLEEIQKSLDMYLETKRQIFPRFYFLSNDDLLEILGQSKNPEAVSTCISLKN